MKTDVVSRQMGNGRTMGDYLLLAGPATRPERLLTCLGHHPDIVALSDGRLTQRLYAAARDGVRRHRSSAVDAEAMDVVSHGRAEGGAALRRLYAEARAATGSPIVILHDPAGPMFPFLQPPELSLLVLVRGAESAAAVIGAVGIERVVAAAQDALAAFQAKVAGFGIPHDRIVTIEEDRLDADPEAGLAEVCRTLGASSDAAAVAAMFAPAWLDVRSEGGA